MKRSFVLGLILIASVLVRNVARADPPFTIPCPAGSPCQSIEVALTDNTHGTITITVGMPQTQAWLLQTAQDNINANLPQSLTQQINLGDIRYLNGRISLHRLTIAIPLPNPVHPHPPVCPHPPLCPHTDEAGIGGPGAAHPVVLIDEYQKELDRLSGFPIPKWHDTGWPTVGKFNVSGVLSFGVDKPAAMPEQHVVVAFSADRVTGRITLQAIQGPFSFSLHGKTMNFAFPVTTAQATAQYGLSALSIADVALVSIDDTHAVIKATIVPAPAATAMHGAGVTRRGVPQS